MALNEFSQSRAYLESFFFSHRKTSNYIITNDLIKRTIIKYMCISSSGKQIIIVIILLQCVTFGTKQLRILDSIHSYQTGMSVSKSLEQTDFPGNKLRFETPPASTHGFLSSVVSSFSQ